jgi:hypothetical protein
MFGNFQVFSYISVFVLAVSVSAWVYHRGYEMCQSSNLRASVTIKEKQDEIATHRPDLDALLDCLRHGRF